MKKNLAAMQADKNAEAVRYWELVYSIDPDYQQVRDHLKREYLMVGMDSFADGRLEEAVGLWQKALQIDAGDEKAKGYLARAEEQLSRIAGMSHLQINRHGKNLLAAVRRGLQSPPAYPPRYKRPDENYLLRLEVLRGWRKTAAQTMGVSSEVVLPRDLPVSSGGAGPRR